MIRNLLLAIAMTIMPSSVFAQSSEDATRLEQRGEDITAAMRGEAIYGEVFADGFVNAVPEAQFLAMLGQIESQFGPMIGIETVKPVTPNGAEIAIRFERGLASGSFTLEDAAPFEITGFVLNDIRPIGDSVEQLIDDIAALPGETSILVTGLGDGEPIAAHNADTQFAIGSTFKLYVLSALARSIAAGERDWEDVVPLSVRSYPSGVSQDWSQGSPVTLHTLATLMISISDNTATDQLIAVLGRDAVEAEVVASGHADPHAMLPFLTTRELFVLKSGDEIDPEEYRGADITWRREALASLAGIERDEAQVRNAFTSGPNSIEIEWLASANDIAAVLNRIVALEDKTALGILAVSSGVSDAMRADWDYVGYKGGSEPGVLNLSWLLRDNSGDWRVVTMSWNNAEAAVDQSAFELLGMRAIALASGE
ncbi:serine hydrolase [Aurantiacibacter odishensis]|uniref:serine hydrolase n=1 Tax=Aurantiacibacter odishensis TaxID=1155476 RepID=UPI000E712F8F|nr:serine hydrolase [Aurantiacibacter odishensis]